MVSGLWIGSRYIYRELILPFIFSISVVTFVLLLNFLIKTVDRLLGKGLPLGVILEFIYLNLAWIIAMSIPMAVLVACLMAYGRLAEDNEITAMRSSGISFITILAPGLIFGLVITLLMMYFQNFVLPDTNHRARLLSGDIYRKRPGLNIEPGYFIDELPEYSIYVKNKSGETLKKVTVYNKDNQQTQLTIYADSGRIDLQGKTAFFTLYSGEIHELDLENYEEYRRINFEKHIITIPVDNMILERRDKARRGDREMTVAMMRERVAKYTQLRNKILHKIDDLVQNQMDMPAPDNFNRLKKIINRQISENTQHLEPAKALRTNRRLKALKTRLRGEFSLAYSYKKQINKYLVEIHKKFAMPFACIIFVLMGAPLGVMTKQGGVPLAAVISILFFLIYYVFLIGGEELADMAYLPPFWAMWAPNILLFIVGSYLIYYLTREQKTIDMLFIYKFLKKKLKDNSLDDEQSP